MFLAPFWADKFTELTGVFATVPLAMWALTFSLEPSVFEIPMALEVLTFLSEVGVLAVTMATGVLCFVTMETGFFAFPPSNCCAIAGETIELTTLDEVKLLRAVSGMGGALSKLDLFDVEKLSVVRVPSFMAETFSLNDGRTGAPS